MSNEKDRQNFSSRTTFINDNPHITIRRKTFADGSETTTLAGYPIVWNALSTDRGGYKVKLAKNSATFTTASLALWNHDFSRPLAGTNNGTLRILASDDIGVPVEIDLDLNTTVGSDTLAYVTSKLVTGMSFSMTQGFEDYTEDDVDGERILTVTKFTSDEVTVTPIPAMTATTIVPKPDDSETPAIDNTNIELCSIATPARIEANLKLHSMRLAMLEK